MLLCVLVFHHRALRVVFSGRLCFSAWHQRHSRDVTVAAAAELVMMMVEPSQGRSRNNPDAVCLPETRFAAAMVVVVVVVVVAQGVSISREARSTEMWM